MLRIVGTYFDRLDNYGVRPGVHPVPRVEASGDPASRQPFAELRLPSARVVDEASQASPEASREDAVPTSGGTRLSDALLRRIILGD